MSFLSKAWFSGALLGAAIAVGVAGTGTAAEISGAGATFPYPVYAKWADAYKSETGIGLNYQSIGSGGGIKQIKARTVTFGASDMPLKAEDLKEAGLVQWPMIMGGAVPAINVKGVDAGKLVLDGPTLAKIYMGDIKTWNDPAIKALNPGLTLPSTAIAAVYRSDGSGTNFLFTDYLSKVSPDFKSKIGANTSVQWPVGIGAKGNEGVANMVKQTDGAIGYVEYAYVKQNKMGYAALKNQAGKIVHPESKTFQAAAANADWAGTPGYAVVLTNEPGAESWPITGASFILMPAKVDDAAAAKQALEFFNWAYAKGGQMADQLDYVPMPDAVVKMVTKTWAEQITDASGKPVLAAAK
ncbi:phosphate ABC transporter substrate-binding protein PstS [Oleisolibacter albus]|uniref:phosphate ABC transporter substrate-binding protein PstS n=1 Tax=Oleisolibacter albus TaxID=2171757 RepID=UPI000DF31083|nr:phosphate ABC transporter substrate-binding protein PstS [Oleisolibacter albus]